MSRPTVKEIGEANKAISDARSRLRTLEAMRSDVGTRYFRLHVPNLRFTDLTKEAAAAAIAIERDQTQRTIDINLAKLEAWGVDVDEA